ncbi:hypothetical protein [Nocardia gamkensis]|nr:hypothetical protein [Nocardia gamkensis]
MDLPGFGLSPVRDGTVSVEDYATCSRASWFNSASNARISQGAFVRRCACLGTRSRGMARSVVAFAPIGFWGAAGAVWSQSALRPENAASRLLLPALVAISAGRLAPGALFYGPAQLEPRQIIEDAETFRSARAFDQLCDRFGDYVFTAA